jgi:hypothetical protein
MEPPEESPPPEQPKPEESPPGEEPAADNSVVLMPGLKPEESEADPLREPVRMELMFPIEVDGKTYSELTLDFRSIKSDGWRALDKTFRTLYPDDFVPVEMIHSGYRELVASRAAKVSLLVIQALESPDYKAVTGLVFQFLGNSLARRKLRARR